MANGQLIADRSPAVSTGTFYRLNVIDNGDGTCFVYVEDRLNSDGVSTPGAVTATGLLISSVAGGGIGGSGTVNRVAKFTAAQIIGNSSITDTGTLVTIANPTNVTGLAAAVKTIAFADSPYIPLVGDYTLLVNAVGGAVAVNLPTAASLAKSILNIKKIDASANAVTITPNGAEKIDGAASQLVSVQYQSISIQSDGSNWYIL